MFPRPKVAGTRNKIRPPPTTVIAGLVVQKIGSSSCNPRGKITTVVAIPHRETKRVAERVAETRGTETKREAVAAAVADSKKQQVSRMMTTTMDQKTRRNRNRTVRRP